MSVDNYNKEQLADMSDEEIVHAELQLDRDLVTLRFQKKAGNSRGVHKSKQVRRAIARLKTEQRAREIAGELEKGSLLAAHRASFKPLDGDFDSGSSFGADLNAEMEEE